MERWQNKVAVVSGASAGIGAACTRALLSAGMVVIGLARRQERVEQLREGLRAQEQNRLHAIRCDVKDEEQVSETFEWIRRHLGGVDALVSNAGIIAPGELSGRDDSAAMRSTVETNIMGTVNCVREAFNSMRERGTEGHVVIINSVAGQQVPNLGPMLPSLNIYPASKFALRAMNEIYRQEFQRHKTLVRVSTISPGMVDTDILPQEIQGVVKQHMPMLRSADVADAVLWTIGTPSNVQVHNITIKPQGEKF
ncbi:farnesol dehydrogenase isoform X2 [Drosophila serrata]|uniref:farnesol dehydrogenase-like n=1 Tax=Drosophila serrata TaxID=7274 RepID=UPI000A1CFFCC|nr:farnesol dehydrogenase-like [Drosophila serrata]XP_020816306.1 farnesol dehydrogenase isoform X2 [Drosophila serrata]